MLTLFCSYFGLFLIHRILFRISEENFFPKIIFEKINRYFLLINVIFLPILAINNSTLGLALIIFQIFFFAILKSVLDRLFWARIEGKMAILYHQIYMEMSAGKSFREALLDYLRSDDSLFSKKLDEVVKMASLGARIDQNSPKMLLQISSEIAELLNTHHKAHAWVKILRRDYQMREIFRQKSRAASSQALIQMGFSGFLYVLFLGFTVKKAGASDLFSLMMSISLFLMGLILSFIFTREPKWKT